MGKETKKKRQVRFTPYTTVVGFDGSGYDRTPIECSEPGFKERLDLFVEKVRSTAKAVILWPSC